MAGCFKEHTTRAAAVVPGQPFRPAGLRSQALDFRLVDAADFCDPFAHGARA